MSVAVAFTYPAPVRADIEVRPASTGCFVESATVILPVPSKATPLIFRAVVSLGADTIVITGAVVGFDTVASLFADDTLVTVPVPPPRVKNSSAVSAAFTRVHLRACPV